MSVFGDIKIGLNQAIKHEQGELKTKTTTLEIALHNTYDALEDEIIHKGANLTK